MLLEVIVEEDLELEIMMITKHLKKLNFLEIRKLNKFHVVKHILLC